MPKNVKKTIKKIARKAKGPAKRIAKAAAQQAIRELRGGVRGFLGRNPLVNAGMRTLTGSGDYRTNSLIRGGGGSHTPSFGSSRMIVTRREYIGRVVSSPTAGEFQITKYTINPGISDSFPWLSQIAANFESYRPLGITYEFKSTSGESVGSTNTALGAVAMAAQYNSFAPDPMNRQQVESLPNAISIAPFENALCGVECKASMRQASTLLVRNAYSNTTVGNAYDTLFDVGDFFIATDGCQGTDVALGELWVTYKIELLNPVLSPVFPWNQTWGAFYSGPAFWNTSCANYALTGDVEKTTPWEVTDSAPSTFFVNPVIMDRYYVFRMEFVTDGVQVVTSPSVVLQGFVLNTMKHTANHTTTGNETIFIELSLAASSNGTASIQLNWVGHYDITSVRASLYMVPNQLTG